jgi:hypothetical protein
MRLPAVLAIVLLAGPVVASADTLEEKFQSLQDAVAKKDAAAVKKLFQEVYPLATAESCVTAPENADEKETWTNHVAEAKAMLVSAEYALLSATAGAPPAATVDLIATLEQANPKSKYLDAAYGPYLVALSQTGAAAKVPGVAEKALVNFPENEDLLLVLADSALTRKQPDRALTYANRLIAVMSKHPKPDGIPAAQWERKRNASLGRGYWISGVIQGERNQYVASDKNLRAALPLIQGNESMMAPALFYLGSINYQLGKMTLNKARILDGAKFSDQCAAIDSAYADQARHNALVMKNEAAKMR